MDPGWEAPLHTIRVAVLFHWSVFFNPRPVKLRRPRRGFAIVLSRIAKEGGCADTQPEMERVSHVAP